MDAGPMMRRGARWAALVAAPTSMLAAAVLYRAHSDNPPTRQQEAEHEFARTTTSLGVDAAAFVFDRVETSTDHDVFYWRSRHRPHALIVVAVQDSTVKFSGDPGMPDCRGDRARVVSQFGEICL